MGSATSTSVTSTSVTPTIIVQNAGNTGIAAIKALLAKGNCNVRTASRDPDKLKEKLKDTKGVKVFKTGDDAFFAGADRFIVIPPGGTPDPDDRAAIATEFLRKAVSAGATHGVVLSVIVAEGRRGLFGRQFGSVENACASMDKVTTVNIRAPMFYQNMWGDVAAIKSHDTFYAPIDGDVKQLSCAVADVGDALAAAVLDPSLGGKSIHVIGSNLTKNQVAALYSKTLGRPIKFAQASTDAATKAFEAFGMPSWQIKGVIELFGLNETDAFVAAHEREFQGLVGRKPMSVQQYIDTALIHGLRASE